MNNLFTDQDLQQAIEDGIFSDFNDVTANLSQVIRWFEKWAEKKRKEAVREELENLYMCDGRITKTMIAKKLNSAAFPQPTPTRIIPDEDGGV